ncbi:hypothetical protein [Ralstonia pseudosolanacearum]|uniref:hypothetical protein n=1 Tax=Ralstonia pseudosolanacearum TaxID=1310165 RepID=UPI003AAC8F75
MKRWSEIADLALKILSSLAILTAGAWALFTFRVGGAVDWQSNLTIESHVLPYGDKLRLLVVQAKSKNPRIAGFVLDASKGDAYKMRVRRLPSDAKVGTVFPEDYGELVASVDLLAAAKDYYVFLPGSEMTETQAFVLPAGSLVSVIVSMRVHNGDLDGDGKPDTQNNSTSLIVQVDP